MEYLREESTRRRQRYCQARPTGAGGAFVQVRRSGDSAGFAGLQSCGSITCPRCGPKISAQRREDISAGVEAWRGLGGRLLFGTFTLRHHRGQSFAYLQDAVAGAWGAATSGRQWTRDRRLHGIDGFLRVWETKWNPDNGWHVHVHFLVFVGEDAGAEELLASMFGRWQRHAVRQGLAAPLVQGQDLHEVHGDPRDVLGQYLSKEFADGAAAGGTRAARSIGLEMTNGEGKLRGDSFTPQQLLAGAVDGVDAAAALWAEYELGMEGRRTIAWSRGLRELLGLDVELTDEEISDREEGTVEDTVLWLPTEAFAQLVWRRSRGALLQRVAAGDTPAQLVAWCAARGWTASADPPPPDMSA